MKQKQQKKVFILEICSKLNFLRKTFSFSDICNMLGMILRYWHLVKYLEARRK